jgi:gliding motility-associated-like protein
MQALAPSVGTGSWTTISATGNFADPLSAQSLVINIPPGSFQYVWTITNGTCSSLPDTMTVTAYANPSAAVAGPDQLVYTTAITMNAVAPSFGAGTWILISGSGTFTDANDPATTITQLEIGTSVFRWTVSNGNCPSTFDDVQVTREAVFIPTGFSPNGDGVNDFFEIPGFESFSVVKIQVFNRWGNIVYASDDYRNDWNGTRLNGENLPEDVYYYVIELGEANEVSGYVGLKRSQL